MAEVLDDRSLHAFQIADTSHELLQLALNSVLAYLKALEMFEDDVLGVFSHFPVSLVNAATWQAPVKSYPANSNLTCNALMA